MADSENPNLLVKQPVLPARIELLTLDLTPMGGLLHRFANCTNPDGSFIQFGTFSYSPLPFKITGMEQQSEGAPARPELNLANVDKFFTALIWNYNNLLNVKVTYRETFAHLLNRSDSLGLPLQKYTIGQRLPSVSGIMKFSLRSPLDKELAYMPKRQMLRKDFPGLGINKRVR